MKQDNATKVMSAVTIFAIIGPVAFMAFDNELPYTYDEKLSHIIPDTASPGDRVTVAWKIKVNRICPGIVERQLVDSRGVRHSYDVLPARRDIKLTDEWITKDVLLPVGLPPGDSIIYSVVFCACNPLQRIWPLRMETTKIHFTIK